jgi:hypothetical protein
LGGEAEDLRELSLTLATVDNALYAFVCKLMLDAGQSAPRRNADLIEALNGSVHFSLLCIGWTASVYLGPDGLRNCDIRMRRRLSATPNKTLPLGGIVSMLFHILSALEDTSAVLEDLRTRRRVRLLSTVALGLRFCSLGVVSSSCAGDRYSENRRCRIVAYCRPPRLLPDVYGCLVYEFNQVS